MLTIVNNYMAIIKVYNKDLTLAGEISSDEKQSILDTAIDNDISILFGCCGGSCGTCKCEIIKGKEYIDKEAIRKTVYSDVKENEFLACIAKVKPNTNEKIIEIRKCI